jgi:hypothetical protein
VNLNIFTEKDAEVIADAVKTTSKTGRAIAREGKEKLPGKTPQVTADDLYSQVLKYVPTPLIGLYLVAVNAALSSFSGDTEKAFLWGIFVLFTIAVGVFLLKRGVKRVSQIAISLAAFVAWVTASPGPFQVIDGYPEVIGTFALLAVTVVALVLQLKPLPADAIEEALP